MIPPAIPPNEKQRLNALYQLNILDTEREERFDRITRIACKLFNVPIAVISFMEAERQWMKSKQGLDISEAKRSTSFCGHALLSDEMMVVEDAKKDRRFFDNPYVLGDPRIRFYVGCPVKVKDCNVGIFCLIDDKPRSSKEIDQKAMHDLTEMVELELEMHHLSTTDELTSLSNRRGFLKIANYLFELCRRENKAMTLLFFDLNKFKQINDEFGHAHGDKILKEFAQALLKHFRKYDVIARLGGDEFCVLISGLNQKTVPSIIERVRKYLDSRKTKPKIHFNEH